MKILVAVKRVIDPYVKIRINAEQTAVETQQVKMGMNPFDEIAIEEALRWKEAGRASEVVAVSIGNEMCQETLRHALALGADKAILIRSETSYCPLDIARILAVVAQKECPQLIVMGKQSIDGDNNQTPQMLASLLNWSQATYASEITPHDAGVRVVRETDIGLETLQLTLPAVISTDLRLNTPRYASLPNIMKARKKTLDIWDVADLGLVFKPHLQVLSVSYPPVRAGGIKVTSIRDLLDKLRHEAKVI